ITFGCISTRQIYQHVKARAAALPPRSKLAFALRNFRDRLRWRDSALQRYYHRPQLAHQNQYPEFDEYYTSDPLTPQQEDLFAAWQEGMTGFPMVDASMRQLQSLGWMNFRMRAMCATFLTINCGISWHHGAEHYMRYLIDGDLAIDHWQWQAQAGITNPLSATFRIYNPTKNLQEKDRQLKFIHEWLPELRGYTMPEILAGQNLSEGYYPPPTLDWSATRRQHGKIVSNLRKRVRARLRKDGGHELKGARKIKEASEKYREARDRQYQQLEMTAPAGD
ncbi:MAG: FAD-binding domain-containing protein, partial [Cyanobacteria bacterium J06641_5]